VALSWNPVLDWDTEGWRPQAACRDVDPEVFFPVGSSGPAVSHMRTAQAVCRSCPVKDPCLQFALVTNQEAGVWGGKDENERRELRRAGRPQQAPHGRPF